MARLLHKDTGKSLILALDHMPIEGFMPEFSNIPLLLQGLEELSVQGVLFNKGYVKTAVNSVEPHKNIIIQLSAGTKHAFPAYSKSIVCSVDEALHLGADAVALHINIGNDQENAMLRDFGMTTDRAHALGVPVLAMMHARGGHIVNELDPALITHCICLGGELGADMVCVPYGGDRKSFSRAVDICPVPVLVSGGPSIQNFEKCLNMIAEVMEAGATGVVLGRNIFQHKKPLAALTEACNLVHNTQGSE